MSAGDDRELLLRSYAQLRGCAGAYRRVCALRLSGAAAQEVAEVALAWARALAAFGLDIRRTLERRDEHLVGVSSAEWMGTLHAVVVLNQLAASFVLAAEDTLVREALVGLPQLDSALEQLGAWRARVEESIAETPEPPFAPQLADVPGTDDAPALPGGMRGPRAMLVDASFDAHTTGVLAVCAAALMYFTDLCAVLCERRASGEDTMGVALVSQALTAAGDLAVIQHWLRERPLFHSLADAGVRAGLVDWQLGEVSATLVALTDSDRARVDGLILAPERLVRRLRSDTARALGELIAGDPVFLISGARRLWEQRADGGTEPELFDWAVSRCRAGRAG